MHTHVNNKHTGNYDTNVHTQKDWLAAIVWRQWEKSKMIFSCKEKANVVHNHGADVFLANEVNKQYANNPSTPRNSQKHKHSIRLDREVSTEKHVHQVSCAGKFDSSGFAVGARARCACMTRCQCVAK